MHELVPRRVGPVHACVTSKNPPPLTDRDTLLRDDPEWLSAAAAYLELRTEHEVLSTRLEESTAGADWRGNRLLLTAREPRSATLRASNTSVAGSRMAWIKILPFMSISLLPRPA